MIKGLEFLAHLYPLGWGEGLEIELMINSGLWGETFIKILKLQDVERFWVGEYTNTLSGQCILIPCKRMNTEALHLGHS